MILVTGCGRTGTTWIGQALAAGTAQRYAHEPFNHKYKKYRRFIHKYMDANDTDYPWYYKRWEEYIGDGKVVAKDVQVLYSYPALLAYMNFDALVVCLRHPCAVADSWHRIGFPTHGSLTTYIENAFSDPRALKRFLYPYVQHSFSCTNWWFQIGVFWSLQYEFITHALEYIHKSELDWWMRYEDIALDPKHELSALLADIIPIGSGKYHTELEAFLEEHNRPKQPHEPQIATYRNSSDEINRWRTNLTDQQKYAVMHGASAFKYLKQFEYEL